LAQTHGQVAGFLGGFVLGGLLWALALPVLVEGVRSRRTQAVAGVSSVVSITCGLALIVFGLSLGYSVVRPLGGHDLAPRASGPMVLGLVAPHRAGIMVTATTLSGPSAPAVWDDLPNWTRRES